MKIKFKFLMGAIAAIFFISSNLYCVNALQVSKQYINKNRSYQTLYPEGLVIHDTDDIGGTAQNNRDYFNHCYCAASVHYFVGWDKTIQTIPKNEVAWHAGYTANHKFLSIEMCVPYNENYKEFNKVYWDTVTLASDICKKYGWTTEQVFSHKYCSNKWHQTDHQDPYAFLNKWGKSWGQLMQDIENNIKYNTQSISNVSSVLSNQNYVGNDTNGTVKVKTSLNVRETPNGNIIGSLNNNERIKINYSCNKDGWYSIFWGNHGGYISNKYVIPDKTLLGIVTAKIGLNVRDSNDNIIGVLNSGQTVKIDKQYSNKNQWSIRYGNHGGLVSKKYIKVET